MDESRLGPAVIKRHLKRLEHERGAHVIGHRPAHDAAREDVLDGGEVEPALPGSEGGDGRDPEPVRAVGGEGAVDEVLADADRGTPIAVRPRRAGPGPLMPAARIKRSTRLRPSRSPSGARASAWIRGDP
jgi:hypothetical protein